MQKQNMPEKESQQTSCHSSATYAFNSPSWRNSSGSQIPQAFQSKSTSLNTDSPHQHFYDVKQLGLQLQDQDSSSTLSTCQSQHELPTIGGVTVHGQPNIRHNDTNGRQVEGHVNSILSLGNPYCDVAPSQRDYNQSLARLPYPYADPYFGGLVSPYGPQTIIAPQMVGMAPTRVPLPLHVAEDGPIFVNAKQYRAILRRRESRAKLEAQNKAVKARKPYLHESRHQHALNRVRGSSGRFLNTKQLQQLNPSTTYVQNDLKLVFLQTGENLSESETGNAGASTTSGSDITSVSNTNGNNFQLPDLRLSGYPPPSRSDGAGVGVGGGGGGGGGGGPIMNDNGYQHHFHVFRYEREIERGEE